MKAQLEQQKLELENVLNERDNDTKLTIAMLQVENQTEEEVPENTDAKDALLEKMRALFLLWRIAARRREIFSPEKE